MPVDGDIRKRAAPKRGVAPGQLSDEIHKRGDAAQNVQHVRAGEDIEKRAVRVGGQVQALRRQLVPRRVLPGIKSTPSANVAASQAITVFTAWHLPRNVRERTARLAIAKVKLLSRITRVLA